MNDPQPENHQANKRPPRHYLAESLATNRLELGAEARSGRVTNVPVPARPAVGAESGHRSGTGMTDQKQPDPAQAEWTIG